jgi:hypothetical protein
VPELKLDEYGRFAVWNALHTDEFSRVLIIRKISVHPWGFLSLSLVSTRDGGWPGWGASLNQGMPNRIINAGNSRIFLLHAYPLDVVVHNLSDKLSSKTKITQMKVRKSKNGAELRMASRFAGIAFIWLSNWTQFLTAQKRAD